MAKELENECILNTLRPDKMDATLADDVFKRMYLNENSWMEILNKISLNYVP